MATNARIGRATLDMTQRNYERTKILCLSVAIALLCACPVSEQCMGPCGMPFPPPPPPMPYLAPPIMAMPPPIFLPPPMPMPVPPPAYAIIFKNGGGETTTSTTKDPMANMNFGIAIPMAPFAMPPPTLVKFPKMCNNNNNNCGSSSESDSSSESCSDGRRRSKKRSGRRNLRKGGRKHHKKKPKLVKPVLSYVAKNGKVQFETKISNVEAFDLLNHRDQEQEKKSVRSGDNMAPRSVKILTKSDSDGKNRLVVIESDEEMMLDRDDQARRSFGGVIGPRRMNNEVNQQMSRGKKQIFFNTPDNRKIANMSIAFQIV